MMEWINGSAWWLMAATVLGFACGAGALFAVALLMPADHFVRPRLQTDLASRHPVLRVLARVLKNIVGIILLVAGIVMAIPMVPGPGVLFILLGLSLTDIPGKRSLGRYIVSRPLVLRPINGLRARLNRPPVQLPNRQIDDTSDHRLNHTRRPRTRTRNAICRGQVEHKDA